MATITEERETALKSADDLVQSAKKDGRELTPEEATQVKAFLDTVDAKDAEIKHGREVKSLHERLGSVREDEGVTEAEVLAKGARTLAEHFVKSGMAQKMKEAKGSSSRWTVDAPEFKAAADPILTSQTGGLQTTYGNVYPTKYRALTIADLLASGSLATATLTYWTQGTLTGDVGSVLEGAAKPNLNFAFGQVTESLAKLAGVTKVSDEMTEDAEFLVSVIQSQLLARLQIIEEDQLLNGNGTAPNLRGLLNRVGIQTYSTSATASPKKWLDGLFHAQNMIRTGAFAEPDGIVVNPADYEYMRLGVDGQQQYYGGGPFTGAYGNDGLTLQPGIWGLPTVVTPAIAQGTALVGAFKTAGQVFRKGGVRLESTNSNEDDFKKNLVAIRIEERLALAVYFPTAFVKVTLTA